MGAKKITILFSMSLILLFVFINYLENDREKLVHQEQKELDSVRRAGSDDSISSNGTVANEIFAHLGEENTESRIGNRTELNLKDGSGQPFERERTEKLFEESKTKESRSTEVVKAQALEPPPTPTIIIPPKEAKGGVYALYRAVLWRDPDPDGGQNATNLFSSIGWSTYIENSRNMISSPEFEERIIPHHDTFSIINRIYSVFLGRCPSEAELSVHFEHLENKEPGQITETVLRQTKPSDVKQIFRGGYSPNLCSKSNE